MSLRSRRATGIRRSRGVVAGLLLVLLGSWGAIIPFVGPKVHYAFGSYASFHFTWSRLWLDVLPGAATVLGGALLITAATRPRGLLGGWLAAAGGVWFAVGVPLSTLWQGASNVGIGPALGGDVHRAAESIGYFYGLGAAITFLAAFSIGRLSVVSVRDVRAAEERAEAEAGVTGGGREENGTEGDGRPPSEAQAPRPSERSTASTNN
jgi:hypothetical protein